MIFTFSPNISIKRKVAYIGVMLAVSAIVLVSMVDINDPVTTDLVPWISSLGIAGLSLLILTLINRDTQSAYSKWGALPSMILISLIPVIVTIFLYLAFIFLSFEELAERYIIINSSWIFATNIPLILIVSFLLHRYSNTDTDTDKITTQ